MAFKSSWALSVSGPYEAEIADTLLEQFFEIKKSMSKDCDLKVDFCGAKKIRGSVERITARNCVTCIEYLMDDI